jgi:NTE family protein
MIAVVCAGAGARGAYEAGALSVLLPWLLEDRPGEPLIMVGTSAGAINAVLFAAALDGSTPVEQAMIAALRLWRQARPSQVIGNVDLDGPRVALRYGLEVLGLPVRLHSLLDSSPLQRTLATSMHWSRFDANLQGQGPVSAVAVAATDTTTDRTTIFLHGRVPTPPSDPVRGVDYRPAVLRPPHIAASAAIPVAFLPVRVGGNGEDRWYVDGGVRLNAPISPALDLGADRVAVVASTPDPALAQAPDLGGQEPDVFAATAVVLRSLLVDRMSQDVLHLRQINGLVKASRSSSLHVTGRRRPYRSVESLYVGPTESGAIAGAARSAFRRYYPGLRGRFTDLGLLSTLLGGAGEPHWELFSFLFFDGRFHADLIDMGQADARRVVDAGWQ